MHFWTSCFYGGNIRFRIHAVVDAAYVRVDQIFVALLWVAETSARSRGTTGRNLMTDHRSYCPCLILRIRNYQNCLFWRLLRALTLRLSLRLFSLLPQCQQAWPCFDGTIYMGSERGFIVVDRVGMSPPILGPIFGDCFLTI